MMEKNIQALITWKLDQKTLDKLKKTFPSVSFVVCINTEEIEEKVPLAQIVYAGIFTAKHAKAAKQLRWLQLNGHGANAYLFPELIKSNVQITNSGQVHSIPISEHVFALLLNHSRKVVELKEGQRRRKWIKQEIYPFLSELYGKSIGIIGVGNIGKEVAKRAKAFGMFVYGVKRDVNVEIQSVDRMYSLEEMDYVLKQSDFIVVTLPETPQTKGLIGKEQLSMMKKEAYLINVGRGSIINENELVHILREKKISGAALDVFQEEPLPKNSVFYELENLFVSPHLSGATPRAVERQVNIFKDNLRRFIENEPFINEVDKERGY
jgi:D-2-hydroxyacid dehydrogenase (NADP+)